MQMLYTRSQYDPVETIRGGGVERPDEPVQDGSRDSRQYGDAGGSGSSVRVRLRYSGLSSKRIQVYSPSFAATHTLLPLFVRSLPFLPHKSDRRAILLKSQDVSVGTSAATFLAHCSFSCSAPGCKGPPHKILLFLYPQLQAPFSHINRRI